MREYVKLFRQDDRFGIETNATDEGTFVRQTAVVLGEAMENAKLQVRRDVLLAELLPHIVDLCCKMRRYQAPLVDEQRVLTTARFLPSESLLIAASEGNGVAKLPETVET